MLDEIDASSGEQARGVQQINQAVQELDRVVQQNAAGAEQMAATVRSLATRAGDLQQTVAFFKLGDVGSGGRPEPVRHLGQEPWEAPPAQRLSA